MRDQKWDILWTQGVVERASNSDLVAMGLANEHDHHVRAAVEWIVTMREAISLADDPHAKVINYDEIVRCPRELIHEALGFCGLPASPRTEAYAEAIISVQESADDRDACSSHLPDALVSAIDEVWFQSSQIA